MDLRHLRYFVAVAETANFTRAAERSFVSQSALSSQIARLEGEVGSPLFLRTSRAVRLTPAGETLLPLARRILAEVEGAEAGMAALVGVEKGRLRLGIIQAGASALDIIGLISAYRVRHPGIELSVRTGASRATAEAVAVGELDLAIVTLPATMLPAGLDHEAIVDDPLVAVVSEATARGLGPEVPVAELVRLGPFIHYMPGSGLRESITGAFEAAGVEVASTIELDRADDMMRLAGRGVGVTVVPKAAVERYPAGERREFVAISLAPPVPVHPIGVAYYADRISPAAAAFLENVKDEAAAAHRSG